MLLVEDTHLELEWPMVVVNHEHGTLTVDINTNTHDRVTT